MIEREMDIMRVDCNWIVEEIVERVMRSFTLNNLRKIENIELDYWKVHEWNEK